MRRKRPQTDFLSGRDEIYIFMAGVGLAHDRTRTVCARINIQSDCCAGALVERKMGVMIGNDSFCTVINCMDGRTQLEVNKYLRERFKVDHVDTITEPGPVQFLAEGLESIESLSILRRVDVSVAGHGSKVVAIVAHYDCTGNPLDKPAQIDQLRMSAAFLRARYSDTLIVKLWVNDAWQVEEVVSGE